MSERLAGTAQRVGSALLTGWAILLLPAGIGLVLYGLVERIDSNDWQEPLSVGVAVFAVGSLVWFLSRRLDASAQRAAARRYEHQLLRLARGRSGRLTATEAAAEIGITAAEAEVILKGLAEGGFVELEVTEGGVIIYRFPEILYASGGSSWARRHESA
ncbi:MAG: hypothetical protein HN712_07945 [Gemmatimonadetes bacterium]|nr:hypothetical protein [Gemmatimonadota bacterium]MBT7860230.1 hypothetical protein [Gemmatimonadota bacterium]